MCSCKTYDNSSDSSIPSELARMADEARGYCLDAPDWFPSGGARASDYGSHGYFQRLTHRYWPEASSN